MQVRSTITPEEMQEAIRLARPKNFWLRFIVANWYTTALFTLVILATASASLHHRPVKWNGVGLFFLIIAALYGYSWYRWKARIARVASSRSRYESISVDSDGVRTTSGSGASAFIPWRSYSKWSEGRNVFLLMSKDVTTILPADDGNRDSIRAVLRSNISSV